MNKLNNFYVQFLYWTAFLKRSFSKGNGTFWNVVWICLEPHVGLWLIWLLVLQVQNLCRVVQCSSDNGISPVKMLKKQPYSKYHRFNPWMLNPICALPYCNLSKIRHTLGQFFLSKTSYHLIYTFGNFYFFSWKLVCDLSIIQ